MHCQYTTYIKQDAIIKIRWYLVICFGRDRPEEGWSRPKHVAKYNIIVIIASCLMYVVYWQCIIYYTDLIIHNGMASLKFHTLCQMDPAHVFTWHFSKFNLNIQLALFTPMSPECSLSFRYQYHSVINVSPSSFPLSHVFQTPLSGAEVSGKECGLRNSRFTPVPFPLTFWRRNYFFNFSTFCI